MVNLLFAFASHMILLEMSRACVFVLGRGLIRSATRQTLCICLQLVKCCSRRCCLCSGSTVRAACCLCRLKELEAAAEHLQAALLAELNAPASGAGATKKKGKAKKGKKKQVGTTARSWERAQCMLWVHCMHPLYRSVVLPLPTCCTHPPYSSLVLSPPPVAYTIDALSCIAFFTSCMILSLQLPTHDDLASEHRP